MNASDFIWGVIAGFVIANVITSCCFAWLVGKVKPGQRWPLP